MATHSYTSQIEFFGGPMDGHTEQHSAPGPFVCVAANANRGGVRILYTWIQRIIGRQRTAVPVAVYELSERCGRACYVYLGSYAVPPQQLIARRGVTFVLERCSDH